MSMRNDFDFENNLKFSLKGIPCIQFNSETVFTVCFTIKLSNLQIHCTYFSSCEPAGRWVSCACSSAELVHFRKGQIILLIILLMEILTHYITIACILL